ncbi:hypothetical protein CAPTEDRAFT_208652 [Capitella teleta]|uniref:Uncharacterized protein n=1 Tax=Capitella teleta TaxID=283909 RepID=R7U872_CAPTE|nr:hypothetical protein CAPTEDRAFT_208652 [Capitella teleta]|eukprot:ELT99295.1 hypothetical protein CAPTEDRAFT_208652 [Capitella teleta]
MASSGSVCLVYGPAHVCRRYDTCNYVKQRQVVYVPSLRPLPPQLKQPPPPPPPPPLPPQIAVSQDGEEGYALSQHLLHQNYPLSPSTSEVHHIRPPPNMTVHPRANSCGSRQPPLVVVPDLSERRRCQSMSGQRSRSTPHWTTLGRPPDYDDVVGK